MIWETFPLNRAMFLLLDGKIKMKNKKGVIRTLEVIVSSLLIIFIILVILSFIYSKIETQRVHIEKLLLDDEFRSAIVNNDLLKAKSICDAYYEKLNLVCEIKVVDLNTAYYETSKEAIIYNLFMFGDEKNEIDKIIRIFLYPKE